MQQQLCDLKWSTLPKPPTPNIAHSAHDSAAALEWKSIQLIWRRHYSRCLNPIDLLSSQNLISNPLQFVTRCPSPQRRALSHLPESSFASQTSPAGVVIFHLFALRGRSSDTALSPTPCETPSTPATCNKGRLLRQYPAYCSPGASFN